MDTDALIERYRKEIEELKRRLAEREAVANDEPVKGRRLSAREVNNDLLPVTCLPMLIAVVLAIG